MDLIFSKRNLPDNSRYKNEFETERRRRVPYGLKTSYRAPYFWAPLLDRIRQIYTMNHFKNEAKK